jgi:hypothetical protein
MSKSKYTLASSLHNIIWKRLVSYLYIPWKMLWDGNECGENKSNENFKTTISSKNCDRPKTTGECGIF